MASLDATLVKSNASAPLGAEVSSGSSKWLPPVPSLIEPSSDLRSGSRAELNTNSVREVMDDSAAPSATSAQPTRPEGRSLPVGAESDPTQSYPTTRVKQLGQITQEFNPQTVDIQSTDGRLQYLFEEVRFQSSSQWNKQATITHSGTYNQQPYLSDSATGIHSITSRAAVPYQLGFNLQWTVGQSVQSSIQLLLGNQLGECVRD